VRRGAPAADECEDDVPVLEEKARAAGIAIEAERARDQSLEAVAARRARTNRFVAELAAMPILDPRSPRDIMDDLDAP
jgi:hypothetical protein